MNLLLSLQKKYHLRDEERKRQKEQAAGPPLRLPQSDEYYLLKNHKWIMLTNVENINYNGPRAGTGIFAATWTLMHTKKFLSNGSIPSPNS